MFNFRYKIFITGIFLAIVGCTGEPLNSPYSSTNNEDIFFSSFQERPKHLDPAKSYSSNEYAFIAQIYEPLLQYHYLKRPYVLVPLVASQMPKIEYYDENFNKLSNNKNSAKFVKYIINIKKNIRFQPHPAFAKEEGRFIYHKLNNHDVQKINKLADFNFTGTRELKSDDYIYQIKRLADPKIHSPIAGVMSEYIYGFKDFRDHMMEIKDTDNMSYKEYFRKKNITGVKKINDYSFSITLRKNYPQFIYWLAMPFFSPLPWEADTFYSQEVLKKRNITLDWYPVGTGPFMLTDNNPNLKMIMDKNPNFRGESYPSLDDRLVNNKLVNKNKDKSLPYINKAVYSLEKEQIPRWNKFLQGYYDNSGIASDNYDQAISFDKSGDLTLTEELINKNIRLTTYTATSTYYIGFNMLDSTIGGNSKRAKLLRQAISIAIDYEEYISIFTNGRGIVAHSPVPPGIFGFEYNNNTINKTIFNIKKDKPVRKDIEYAKKLLVKAGYTNGIDKKTNKPLVLYFEAVGSGPDTYSFLNWLRKQFAKINIQLVTRVTDYNRFQEKMIKGTGQIFQWGWNADYPDPENFLFLLYSKNGKVKYGGENASNYSNKRFDKLFIKMKNMENSKERLMIINEMIKILQDDCPWIWGIHPKSFLLSHDWVENLTPNLMANNTLKYLKINDTKRKDGVSKWNKPSFIIIYLFLTLISIIFISSYRNYKKKEKQTAL